MSFERIKFPDGQISVKVNRFETAIDDFLIKERINSYEDLFYIRSIAEVINSGAVNTLHSTQSYRLFIPCLFGQRSDRRFDKNQSFDLKVICDFINGCDFGSVTIFDPHSDVSMALINRSVKKLPTEFVARALGEINIKRGQMSYEGLILISPDAGAYKKVFEFGKEFNLPVVGAMKHRDREGNVDLTFTSDVTDKDCLIIDDLCDGGFTFNILAKALRENGAKTVYLYVSHGLFSKGFEKLMINLDGLYCTNSISDIDTERGHHWNNNKWLVQFKVI